MLIDPGGRGRLRSQHPSVPHDIELDNFLRLETRQLSADFNEQQYGESNASVEDIHMTGSRRELDDMYMQIYGLPETWLRLISQTTRLANVMDHRNPQRDRIEADRLVSLESYASRLENTICGFAYRMKSQKNSPGAAGDFGARGPHVHMVCALSFALVIFFYRRIKHANPWILQGHVDSVIQSLHNFDAALLEHSLSGPGTAWPAFIAGSEAMDPEQRQPIIKWLDAAISKCGFRSYESAKEIIMEVWRRRDDEAQRRSISVSESHTWMDTCRDMKIWPLLC